MLSRIQTAIADLHLPTLVMAIIVAIGSAITVNGQPVDLSTGSGRTVAVLALFGVAAGAYMKWLTVQPPTVQQAGLTAADIAELMRRILAEQAATVQPPAAPVAPAPVSTIAYPAFASANVTAATAAPDPSVGIAATPADPPASVPVSSAWAAQNNLPPDA